jgi:hypothetical protein
MFIDAFNLQSILSGVPQFALGVAASLGVYKYYVEPRQMAGALRRKCGTALWIACKELNVHGALRKPWIMTRFSSLC